MKDLKRILKPTQEIIKILRLTRFITILVHINLSSLLMQETHNSKTEVSESSKTESCIKENTTLKQAKGMGVGSRFGQMVQDMKVIGNLIKLMVKEE